MAVEYAPRGLIGVLTPQANTTVEPELAIMVPAGFGWINARLVSGKPTIEARLVDYYATLEGALGQFANAPIRSIAIACTGASYLVGAAGEDDLVARWEARAGVPVVTAGKAVVEALHCLGATRIGLVSPYTAMLDDASRAYWSSRGFVVAHMASAFRESSAFHPIYSLGADAASVALTALADADVDAVVMLGTGMPTLAAILRTPRLGRAPVMSCMSCMTWRALLAAEGESPTRENLLAFTSGEDWGGRNRLIA